MEDYYAHIDDYMNGLLEGEELRLFEAEMKRNPSLKKAVENYEPAKQISEGLLEIDMLETLKGLKDSDRNQDLAQNSLQSETTVHQLSKTDLKAKPKKKKFNITSWLVAASMLGIIAFTGLRVMEMNEEARHKKYVLANYERPIDEDATKSIDTVGMTSFEKGKYLFALNRFEESILVFESYLLEVSEKKLLSRGYFWLGAAYLEVWRVEDAREAWGKSEERGVEENLKLLFKTN